MRLYIAWFILLVMIFGLLLSGCTTYPVVVAPEYEDETHQEKPVIQEKEKTMVG